jgi:uncharacterized protein (TIGR00730 family)
MVHIKSICVFCGSSGGRDPRYSEAAQRLGLDMARSGIRLVYGGGGTGLMGTVARSVLDNGGQVTGIIPEFLVRKEIMLDGVDDLIVVPDMHTRKRMMFDRADAFVALPGGIGTLEEVVEQLTWAQLGRHKKPIVLADIGGFWAPLMDLLTHMRNEAFVRDGYKIKFQVADTPEAIVPMIQATAERIATTALKGDAKAIDLL